MSGPFITKHNRAGKGLGVALFHDVPALERHLASPAFQDSVDGITLIQEYIRAPEPFITRVEFVGGEFLYAVRVDTSRRHRRYKKIVRLSKTLHAHDERNEAHEGDLVRVIETRPLSATKRWRLIEVLERAK